TLQRGLSVEDVNHLDQLRHQPRPPGLVARPEPSAVVTVEILVKKDEIAPVGIRPEPLDAPVSGALPLLVTEEDPGEAPGNLHAHLEEVHHPAGSRRALDQEVVAVVEIVL